MALSKSYVKNSADTVSAIRWCLETQKHLPALVLIYSFIDSLAWAASERKSNSSRIAFESWVENWMLPSLKKKYPRLESVDLYAARCAALHTQTGDSSLSQRGEAKRIVYAWGTGRTEKLRAAIEHLGQVDRLVELHYDDLFSALVAAIQEFAEAAERNPELAKRVDEAAGMHYANIPA